MKHSIGEMIHQARQNRKMTQEEFASRLGVTPQAVSKWERDISLPDITLVQGICDILQMNANELLGTQTGQPITESGDIIWQKEIKSSMIAEPLFLEVGEGLVDMVAEGLETDLIAQERKRLAKENGYLMPLVWIRDSEALPEMEFRIHVYDEVMYQETITPDANTFSYMVEELVRVCRENYTRILNKQIVKVMVDTVKELYPGVADGLVPEQISYLEVEQKLREEVLEKGNIRDMIHILEEMENQTFLKHD